MIVPLNSAAQHNPPASPFRTLFDSFVRDFRVENPSPRTIEVYTESARQLEAFLREHGRPLDPARIRRGDVADFLEPPPGRRPDAGHDSGALLLPAPVLQLAGRRGRDRTLADGAPARAEDPGPPAGRTERDRAVGTVQGLCGHGLRVAA